MRSSETETLLRIEALSVSFASLGRRLYAVRDLTLSLQCGEIVALVGESGCGKSLLARAILALPPENARLDGRILFQESDLLSLPEECLRSLRGRQISMIFQEPMTALNPVLTCGHQAAEVLSSHAQTNTRARVIEMFTRVGIPEAESRFDSYPHQLSGGMRQRVLIAMSLLCDPLLLLADEPTTALDVNISRQILALLVRESRARHMAVLFISHDLRTVATFADRVCVMYAGRLVEQASVSELFANPLHPYTRGLLNASQVSPRTAKKRLLTIPGAVPSLAAMPPGCPFAPRCPKVLDICREHFPAMRSFARHHVACFALTAL